LAAAVDIDSLSLDIQTSFGGENPSRDEKSDGQDQKTEGDSQKQALLPQLLFQTVNSRL
jgi:hypothetical protein